MKIQYLGQNCFLFSHKGKNILSDPFYNFGKAESGFDLEAQTIDYVLITHAHGDHTADVKEVLHHHPDAKLIGQPEICAYFEHPQSIDMNFGGTTKIEDLEISMVPASHTSSFPDGRYGGEPAGYMLKTSDITIYFAGDTGISAEMEILPRFFGKIDLAVLPIGGHYTMCAEKAAFAAAELIKTPKVIGCHFDTFEPIKIDHQAADMKFKERGVELVLPKLGEILEIRK